MKRNILTIAEASERYDVPQNTIHQRLHQDQKRGSNCTARLKSTVMGGHDRVHGESEMEEERCLNISWRSCSAVRLFGSLSWSIC